jgi:hypothetical protein
MPLKSLIVVGSSARSICLSLSLAHSAASALVDGSRVSNRPMDKEPAYSPPCPGERRAGLKSGPVHQGAGQAPRLTLYEWP